MKTISNYLPTLFHVVNLNENLGVKKSVVLSPGLQRMVNALLQTHSDLESFMKVMNPPVQQYCAEHEDKAFFGTAPSLLTLRRAYHDEAATMWMLPQLYDLCEYCGVREKLDESQMTQLARVIITEFPYLKVSEIMLFLHRFKAGRYGRFYGAIDPMVIMTALRFDFMDERAAAIYEREHAEERAAWEAHCREVARERAEARAAGRPMYPRMVTPPDKSKHDTPST